MCIYGFTRNTRTADFRPLQREAYPTKGTGEENRDFSLPVEPGRQRGNQEFPMSDKPDTDLFSGHSGNVIFSSDENDIGSITKQIVMMIKSQFDFQKQPVQVSATN